MLNIIHIFVTAKKHIIALTFPLQQGLRLPLRYILIEFRFLREYIPLQQG